VFTLIPGFAGVGTIVAGLLEGNWKTARGGAWSVLISLIMFGIFGSFLGGPAFLGDYWPALLILLGVLVAGQAVVSSSRKKV
jgi:hypothetical protein